MKIKHIENKDLLNHLALSVPDEDITETRRAHSFRYPYV